MTLYAGIVGLQAAQYFQAFREILVVNIVHYPAHCGKLFADTYHVSLSAVKTHSSIVMTGTRATSISSVLVADRGKEVPMRRTESFWQCEGKQCGFCGAPWFGGAHPFPRLEELLGCFYSPGRSYRLLGYGSLQFYEFWVRA